MKTSLFLNPLCAFAIMYSSSSYASGGEGLDHRRGQHKHQHSEEERYYSEQPRDSNYQDTRSHQGLVGGGVGYEIGNDEPIATGLGAAAGS